MHKLYLLICLSLFAIGMGGLAVRFSDGLRVTHLGSLVPWGIWVALYIYFIGLSAGSFLLSTLIYVFGVKKFEPIGRYAVLQATVCLIVGLFFIFIDLGRPERFWRVIFTPQRNSVLAWEVQFYNIYLVILLMELYFLMRRDLIVLSHHATPFQKLYRFLSFGSQDISPRSLERDVARLRFLGMVGIPIALGVHGGTGAIFAVVKARPYWYTPLFPIVFIVSALASGGAFLLFNKIFYSERPLRLEWGMLSTLARLTSGLLIFDLILLSVEFLVGLYGGIPDHVKAYSLIATGPFWWIFWVVQLLLGAAIPITLIHSRLTGSSVRWLAWAGFLIVVGIIGVRLNIVIPPLAIPPFPSYTKAYHSARVMAFYSPSLIEWLVSLGGLAMGALLFMLGARILPMEELIPTPERRLP